MSDETRCPSPVPSRFFAPAGAQPICDAGNVALIYDLEVSTGWALPARMLTCGRGGGGFGSRTCGRPTRYLLLRPDNGLGYGICEHCIEDFEFWQDFKKESGDE